VEMSSSSSSEEEYRWAGVEAAEIEGEADARLKAAIVKECRWSWLCEEETTCT